MLCLEPCGQVFILLLLDLLSHMTPRLGFCSVSPLFASFAILASLKSYNQNLGFWNLGTKKHIGFGI